MRSLEQAKKECKENYLEQRSEEMELTKSTHYRVLLSPDTPNLFGKSGYTGNPRIVCYSKTSIVGMYLLKDGKTKKTMTDPFAGYDVEIIHDPTQVKETVKTDKDALYEDAVSLGFEGGKNTGEAKLLAFIAEAKS